MVVESGLTVVGLGDSLAASFADAVTRGNAADVAPILVYFKETATPKDKWDEGPGQFANSDAAVADGAVKGQVHFFPAIVSKAQIEQLFIERGCGKLEKA